MNCINRNTKEFKKLAGETQLSPIVLAMQISQWQIDNNTDAFPSASDITGYTPEVTSTFVENSHYELIGTPKEYLDYSRTTETPTEEGFRDYMANKAPLTTTDSIESAQRMFSNKPSGRVEELLDYENDSPDRTYLTESSKTEIDNNFHNLFFGGKREGVTAKDVATSLVDNYGGKINPVASKLIERISKLTGLENVAVSFEGDFELMSAAYYDSATQTIHINKDVLSDMSTDAVISTLLHEMIHYKTVDSINNPQTQQDLELIEAVDGALEKIGNREEYGFTSREEFVAELYSNPEFYDLVKSEFEGTKQNFFQRIIDSIRRMLGIAKTTEFDKLFETVVKSVEQGPSERAVSDLGIFNKIIEKTDHFDTTEKHLLHINDMMKDNISKQIKNLQKAKSDLSFADKQFRLDKLVTLFEMIEQKEKTQPLVAMYYFAAQMKADIASVRQSIQDSSLIHDTDKVRMNNIALLDKILDDYDMISDMRYYIESIQKESSSHFRDNVDEDGNSTGAPYKFSEQDINTLRNIIDEIDNVKTHAEQMLIKEKQEIAELLLSNPLFLTKAEKILKDKYAKEYGDGTGHNMTKEAYIADRFESKPEELKELLEYLAKQFIYNPSDDIQTTELKLSDMLNLNSNLLSVAANMIMDTRLNILSEFKSASNIFRRSFINYSKNNTSNDTAIKYGKLIRQDSKGKHYLINQYKMEMLESWKEMLKEANAELYGAFKPFKVSPEEYQNVRDIGGDFLFRNEDDNSAVGRMYNLQSGDTTTTVNVKFKNKTKFDKGDTTKYDEVAKAFTKYNSYEELVASKDYDKADSFGSKANPQLYEYFKGNADLIAIQYNREFSGNKNYKRTAAYAGWISEHYEQNPDNRIIINDVEVTPLTVKEKYRNPEYDALSDAEVNALKLFEKVAKEGTKTFGSFNSLETVLFNEKETDESVSFTQLPTMNKSDMERRLAYDFKGMAQNFVHGLKNIQHDDYQSGAEPLNADGSARYGLRVHQRGYIKPEHQSLELFDLFLAEKENLIKYANRKELEQKLKIVADVSKNKEYFHKSPKTGNNTRNSERARNPIHTIKGVQSNEYSKIVGLMESSLYDIYSYHGGKVGGFEVNKIAAFVNGFAASVALTANAPTGIANIVNGRAQLQLDAIGRYHFNTKDLMTAEKDYFKELANSIADLRNPVKTSKVNLMLEMFDFVGGVALHKQSFLKDSFGKKLLSKETANAFNDMGEHYMASVLTQSILSGVKAMNEKRQYIDKEGNVVESKEKAASVYDMLVYDKDAGTLTLNPKMVYTSHTMTVKMSEGGLSHLSMLVKKRSHDLYGTYDTNVQPELQKQWWGKSVMMFKRFLIPGLQYRYRNWKTMLKHPDEMSDGERLYNTSLKEYEEGYYITLGRMIYQGTKALKSEGLKYIPEYYNKLSDYEKANIKKAVTEIAVRLVILPALALAIIKGWDDDKPYWLLYQVARLSSELGQFSNPLDMTKILQNPVAGMNSVQNTLKLAGDLIFFINANPQDGESYLDWLNEDVHGNNKLFKSASRLTPVLSQFSKEYKNLYNAIQ